MVDMFAFIIGTFLNIVAIVIIVTLLVIYVNDDNDYAYSQDDYWENIDITFTALIHINLYYYIMFYPCT